MNFISVVDLSTSTPSRSQLPPARRVGGCSRCNAALHQASAKKRRERNGPGEAGQDVMEDQHNIRDGEREKGELFPIRDHQRVNVRR